MALFEKPLVRFWRPNWAWIRPRRAGQDSARPTLSLSQHLGLLTLLVALPLIVVPFYLVGRFADSERHARRAFLVAATHSLAGAVDREVDRYFVISNALSHSRSLLRGDLAEFAQAAAEALGSLPDASLDISTPDGAPLLGAHVRLSGQSDLLRTAVATGAPFVSDVDFDLISQTPVAAVVTPIFQDGKPLYVMTLTMNLRRFSTLLHGQQYPSGWIAAIVDRTGKFVARAPEGPARAGSPAAQPFRDAMQRTPASVIDSVSLEGDRVISAYLPIGYGWTVALAVDTAVLDGSLSQALFILSLVAAGSLAASFALSLLVNRRLAFGVRLLQETAKDIGEGRSVVQRPTGVREFDQLSLTFAEASALLDERAVQKQIAETERSASEERFRVLADSLPQLVWTAGPDGRVDYTNARREKYGKVGLSRTDWNGVIHPEDLRGTVAAWRKASESGEPYEMEHRLMVIGEGFSWHLSRAIPARDASGKLVKWYGTTMDIHEHKMREEHVRVLMTEVNHRSKNLLAVTQAIARQTASSSATAAEFEQKFSGRLLGLAASQDLLTELDWRGVQLKALVHSQIRPYYDVEDGRFRVAGHDVLLDSTATQALGMALHELSTNAARYGALSDDGGHIAVSWRIDGSGAEPMLEMDWIERGGPAVVEPPTHGFGRVVIEKMLSQRLNAVVRLTFDIEGLTWRLSVALKNIVAGDDFDGAFARDR
jgi:PAS domain S-box-containing protein